MVESFRIHRIQGCEATFPSPTAGSPQIDGRNPRYRRARTMFAVPNKCSVTPCSPPSRRGLPRAEHVSPTRQRPSLTAAALGVTRPRQVGTKKRPSVEQRNSIKKGRKQKAGAPHQRCLTKYPIQGWAKGAWHGGNEIRALTRQLPTRS